MDEKVKKEREDFTTLFERCRKPFTQFAYSYMRDWEVAEDIFSEAMVQYWMKRDELDVDTNPRAYILTYPKFDIQLSVFPAVQHFAFFIFGSVYYKLFSILIFLNGIFLYFSRS